MVSKNRERKKEDEKESVVDDSGGHGAEPGCTSSGECVFGRL